MRSEVSIKGAPLRRALSLALVFSAGFGAPLIAAIAGAAPLPGPAAASSPASAAQALALKIDHHYNSLHTLSVHFTQQYDGMGLHRSESGVLLLKKAGRLAPASGKMRWTYDSPAGKLFILDGHDAYFYTPGQTEIPRVPAAKLDDLRSPLRFLLGHSELAKDLDGLTLSPDRRTLTGVPYGMEKRIASLAITASPDGVIERMRVEETDGAINTFILTGEVPNAPAADGEFVFHAPPGTHVVEGMSPL